MTRFKIPAAALPVLRSAAAQNSARFALGQVASPGGTGARLELRIGRSADREARLSVYAIQDTSGIQLADQWGLWNGQIGISYGRLGQPPSVDTMSRNLNVGLTFARWLDDGASFIWNIGWSPTMTLKVDVELLDSNGTPADPWASLPWGDGSCACGGATASALSGSSVPSPSSILTRTGGGGLPPFPETRGFPRPSLLCVGLVLKLMAWLVFKVFRLAIGMLLLSCLVLYVMHRVTRSGGGQQARPVAAPTESAPESASAPAEAAPGAPVEERMRRRAAEGVSQAEGPGYNS